VDSQNSENTLILNDPDSIDSTTVTIGSGSLGQYASAGQYSTTASSIPYGNITIKNGGTSASGSSYLYSTGAGSQWSTVGNITTSGTNTPSLKVTGDAEFEEDIKIKGISVLKTLEAINKRLAILQPDPAKLEKFEALQKAYDHYKLLEALCHEEKNHDN
jgi:hypothetical protein